MIDTVVAVTSRIGFTLIRSYFIKVLESEDLTDKQIITLFQEKIEKVQKDLQDLKLQKLRSAVYLFKSGVSMFEAGDFEESKRNFDKSEDDAIEGFATAPDLDWKELATKISVSSHIWRRIILVQSPNIDAVIKQILMHLQRLTDEDIIRNNVKTHLDPSFSIMRKINKGKRQDIIRRFVDLHQICRKILFDNFLEILPGMIIEFQPGKYVKTKTLAVPYSQGSSQNDIVPYSPNQCRVAQVSPLIDCWENVLLQCSEGMLTMVAHGYGHNVGILYKCCRMSHELPGTIHPVKKWFIYPIQHSDDKFELVFLGISIKYQAVNTAVKVCLIVNDIKFNVMSDYRDASHIRTWIDLHEEFFRRHELIREINERTPDKIVLEMNVEESVDVASVTVSYHHRKKNIVCKGLSGLTDVL